MVATSFSSSTPPPLPRAGIHTVDALHHAVLLAIQDSRAVLRRHRPPGLEQQLRAVRAETQSTEEALRASQSARERNYFKVVAKLRGQYVSIFDGQTIFRLGERTTRMPAVGRRGAFFVFTDIADAIQALHGSFPSSSKLVDAPRAVLRVTSEQRHERTAHGKCMLWSLTPIAEVAIAELARPRSAPSRRRPRWRM